MMSDFDQIQYGRLCQQVDSMEVKMQIMDDRIEKLLALANQSKGGFWVGLTVVSMISAGISWLMSHLGK